MTEQIQIKLSEKDLKEILCQRFDLQSSTAKLNVHKLEGNQREPEFVEITITADRTKQSDLNKMYYEK
jgi:hypothetical protein